MNAAGLDLGTVTLLVAVSAGLTFLALCVVFGGFFAERRLPASHVEAWLATVVSRAGPALNVLPKAVLEMREALGLPALREAADSQRSREPLVPSYVPLFG